MANPTNNFNKVASEIKTALQALTVEGSEKTRLYTDSVKFEKSGLEVTIEFRLNVNIGTGRVLVKDDKGDEYLKANLIVQLNYQRCGYQSIKSVLEQAWFITACCEAAEAIEKVYKDAEIYQLWRTVEDKAEATFKINALVVKQAVAANSKGMRVGNLKSFWDGTFSERLVPGGYTVEVGKKVYQAAVTDSKVVEIRRVS
jgi:hypothetical protein